MASNECEGLRIIDPVEGLLDYIDNVKPFHTKVAEVLVEYAYTENLSVAMGENFYVWPELEQFHDDAISGVCEGGYGCGLFGNPIFLPVLSPNLDVPLEDYPALNSTNRTIIVPGDRSSSFNVSDTFELVSKIEDVSSISRIMDVGANHFIVQNIGIFGTSFDSVFSPSDEIYTTGITSDDERTFTIVTITPNNPSSGLTRVDVAETINTSVPIGHLGLVKTSGNNDGDVFSVSDVFKVDGSTAVFTHTILTVNEAIVPIDDSITLAANQSYQVYLRRLPTMPVSINKVLSYSNYAGLPTDSPDEGVITRNVTGATISTLSGGLPIPGTGQFRVSGNITRGNIFPGEWLHVTESILNNGTYIITDITYDGGNDETVIGVEENVRDDTADGILRIDVPSNMFYVHGNLLSFFNQGVEFLVTGGTYAGFYTTAYSDFVNGNTRIRPIEGIITRDDGFPIQNIVSGNVFEVGGDKTAIFTVGSFVNIVDSSYNDGMYTVNGSTYASGTDTTTLTVNENILDVVVDGIVVLSVLGDINNVTVGFSQSGGYCGFALDTSSSTATHCANVLSTAAIFDEDFKVDWGTSYTWRIISTNSGASTITVDGDITSYLGSFLTIADSQGNDGNYAVTSSGVNYVPEPQTVITVSPSLPTDPPVYELGWALTEDNTEITWFQFMLIEANSTTNQFTVKGDVTNDITNGGNFRVVGTTNYGFYTVTVAPTYNPTTDRSTVQVSNIPNDESGGWIEHV